MSKKKIIKSQLLETKAYILREYQKSLDKWNEYTEKCARAQDKSTTTANDNYYHSDEYISNQKALVRYWEGVCNSYKWTIDWLDEMLKEDKKNGNRY